MTTNKPETEIYTCAICGEFKTQIPKWYKTKKICKKCYNQLHYKDKQTT